MKKIVSIVLVAAFALAASAQEPATPATRSLLNPNRMTARPRTLGTAPAVSQKASDPGASKIDPGGRAIEFNGAALDMVLMVYGNLVGKTVLKDPSVPAASITLQPKQDQELTDEEKILAIETVLEMNGVHLEPYGDKFVRALPRANVRKDGIPVMMDPESELGDTSKVVSMMLSFQNIALEEAQKALEGLKSDKGVLNVYERTGSILVTDTELNIKRMREIARKIDVPTSVNEDVFYYQVKYASAADIKTALEAIVQESQKELEKQGKQANNVMQNRGYGFQPQTFQPGGMGARRLLGAGNGNQPQPQQSASLASIVTSVSDADRGMIRGKVLILSDERSNKLIVITAKSNWEFFKKVIEQLDVETTPDIVVKVYRLKYADSEDVSDMINDLIGNSSSSKSSSRGNQNQNARNGTSGNITRATTATTAKKPANQRSGEAKTGELSKDNTTVLSDKRINGLVVMTNKELVPTLEQIIESMDIKLSQVLIETVIVEVSLGDGIEFGIDWVQNGRFQGDGSWSTQTKTGDHGLPMYWYKKEDEGATPTTRIYEEGLAPDGWTKIGEALTEGVWKAGEITKDGLVTGSSGYSQMFGGGANNGKMAASVVQGLATNVFGSAINYVFKSDKLNLSAILQATKTDSRAKYVASPVVMTVDNKEATIEATQARKFLSNYQTSSSYYGSTPAPQYENKDIGIKIKVTPKINPNGTVMLEVEEEYSQVGAKQSILDPNSNTVQIDTSLTRKMTADALLENNQTVILCGLTETQTTESLTGIPWLMDIPWIGKWLFSKVSQSEARSELLIFMTPYVLTDGESAQAEALRRKRALSDPRPFDTHGWSASPIADAVSQKEQIRRLKDAAEEQDEERKTKLAIEQWKVDRVKELKNLSKTERDLWLQMHKDELVDEEAKKDLEAKIEGTGSESEQEELEKLAASIREKRLAEAEKEIKAADEKMAAENEHEKLEAEKKAKAETEAEKEKAGEEKK